MLQQALQKILNITLQHVVRKLHNFISEVCT